MKQLANGKVELEVGDEIKWKSFNKMYDVFTVVTIKNGEVYRNIGFVCNFQLTESEYWVNGIKYSTKDIIIPQDQPGIQFENEQHERLHNALIKAGFTYDNKRGYNESFWKHGYYNEKLDQALYWECLDEIRARTINKVTNIYGLFLKPIQTIIEYYENLNKENIVQYQEITKDNIREVLKFNNIAINNPAEGYPDWISFNNLDLSSAMNRFSIRLDQVPNWLEVIELVVGKLKPLPKELSLVEWFDKLESGYKLTSILESYMIKDDSKTCIGIIGNWIPRPQQEELILKIIEVYGSVK